MYSLIRSLHLLVNPGIPLDGKGRDFFGMGGWSGGSTGESRGVSLPGGCYIYTVFHRIVLTESSFRPGKGNGLCIIHGNQQATYPYPRSAEISITYKSNTEVLSSNMSPLNIDTRNIPVVATKEESLQHPF